MGKVVNMDKKKMANNILELLVDPTKIPVENRLYIGPNEILDNRAYQQAKMDAEAAYGNQAHNSDFYPIRNRSQSKEGSTMDRRTLIASFDILSQSFMNENDPIAKDLRTMAYAVSQMPDEELERRLAQDEPEEEKKEEGKEAAEKTAGNPWMDHMKKVRKENPGKSVKELIGIAKKTYKKKASEEEIRQAEEMLAEAPEESPEFNDVWNKEAANAVRAALLEDAGVDAGCKPKKKEEETEKEAGKVRGEPDGTGPYGRGMGPGKGRADGTGLKKKEEATEEETSEEKKAGKIKGPGKPDGTGPMSGTEACPESQKKEEKPKKKAEEKPAEEVEAKDQNKPPKGKKEEEGKWSSSEEKPAEEKTEKPAEEKPEEKSAEEKSDEKSAEESTEADDSNLVDTSMLTSTDIQGFEFNSATTDEAELDDSDHKNLDQIFRVAEVEDLDDNEKAKLDHLFQ